MKCMSRFTLKCDLDSRTTSRSNYTSILRTLYNLVFLKESLIWFFFQLMLTLLLMAAGTLKNVNSTK